MCTKLSLLFVCLYIIGINGHTYHTGQCPQVEPMQGFNMAQFLGVWYAIQKTSTASTCLIYNVTRNDDEPNEYNIEQTSQHFVLGLTPLKHEYSYTGKLTIQEPTIPAAMTVRFPLSVAGSAKYIVFMTDYNTYAGIFTCQRLAFAHRLSATILSRTRSLDKVIVDKIRQRLSSYSVSPFDMSIINQSGCPRDGADGLNIAIDPNTLSSQNIGNVVRKAGEKVGDGVEFVIDSGKKAYGHISNSDRPNSEVETFEVNRRGRLMSDNNNNNNNPNEEDDDFFPLF